MPFSRSHERKEASRDEERRRFARAIQTVPPHRPQNGYNGYHRRSYRLLGLRHRVYANNIASTLNARATDPVAMAKNHKESQKDHANKSLMP